MVSSGADCVTASARDHVQPKADFDCMDVGSSQQHIMGQSKLSRRQNMRICCAIVCVCVGSGMLGFFILGPFIKHALAASSLPSKLHLQGSSNFMIPRPLSRPTLQRVTTPGGLVSPVTPIGVASASMTLDAMRDENTQVSQLQARARDHKQTLEGRQANQQDQGMTGLFGVFLIGMGVGGAVMHAISGSNVSGAARSCLAAVTMSTNDTQRPVMVDDSEPQATAAMQPPPAVEQCKTALLASVAELQRTPTRARRDAVLKAVADLEACEETKPTASPEGRWALIFSTQASAPDPSRVDQNPFIQPIIDATYGLFFKVAPQLAGAQQDGGGRGGSNEQRLSLTTGLVENRVRIPLPAGGSVEIFVDGEVAAVDDSALLRVAFTECSFLLRPPIASDAGRRDDPREGALRVPLPRPVGTLRTTFCDETLRVSRGGRGGVFVLRRLRER